LLGIGVIAALVIGWQVSAFAVLSGSNFQANDGDLVPTGSEIDWNSFAPVQWDIGTAPYRETTEKIVSGWKFKGIEDDQTKNSDTGFAGGTKQDNDCANVIGAKAPNKDDLKRIYLSSTTRAVGTEQHTFLNLAWVRIPQNTTSPSAHVAFEFNKAEIGSADSCGDADADTVHRTPGDLLVVYDFEGGSTDTPHISLRKWTETAGDACDVANNSPTPNGCWGTATDLTDLDPPAAEAKVNTFGQVTDLLTPPAPPATTSISSQLGTNEFGEAGIDLTEAGVFQEGVCESFGTASAVSRSTGNSGTAQMKDLVGPAPFDLQNCGSLKIIKQTSPGGLNQEFAFTGSNNFTGGDLVCSQASPETPTNFSLNDSGNTGNTESTANTQSCTGVPVGTYTFTEAATTGFTLDSITCTPSGATGGTGNVGTRTATINISAGSSVTCVFTNSQNKQSILNTDQGFIPNDTATITGTGITSGGSVNFQLIQGTFDTGEDCAAEPTGTGDTKVYEKNVAVTGTTTLTASTTNTGGDPTTASTTDGYTILDGASEGAYYWRVSYSDGAGGNPDVVSCNENSNVQINDGTEVKEPPSI